MGTMWSWAGLTRRRRPYIRLAEDNTGASLGEGLFKGCIMLFIWVDHLLVIAAYRPLPTAYRLLPTVGLRLWAIWTVA